MNTPFERSVDVGVHIKSRDVGKIDVESLLGGEEGLIEVKQGVHGGHSNYVSTRQVMKMDTFFECEQVSLVVSTESRVSSIREKIFNKTFNH